jgi:DNA-binding response OmpR family regulator
MQQRNEDTLLRALIVEGTTHSLKPHARYIAEDGFALAYADCSRVALAAAHAYSPDIVVVNVVGLAPPVIDILRQLRAELGDVGILVLTAREDVEGRIAALEAGADDALSRPLFLPELLARMHAVLRRRGQLLGRAKRLDAAPPGTAAPPDGHDRAADTGHSTAWLTRAE